jgi:glutaredoxin
MVTIVKHEWHQHDRQYAIEIDEELLGEIYPDLDEDEIKQKLADIESGEIDYEDVFNDASDNDVEIDWEFQYDDCWTDRKGGYDITYELGDESSWVVEPEPAPHTHKCTNCKWTGQSYDAEWSWVDKDGTEIDDPRKVCPYCESDTELTEAGVIAEKESAERTARWAKEVEEEDEELVDEAELEEALEELKAEFETLTTEDDGSLQESYPEDTYTIRVWGRTREIGVHKIKKAQYEHWSSEDHEDDLSDALNESYDYDENKTPKAAQFDLPYYEYQGKHSFWGFDQDDTHMTIENSEGETIYDGDIESFFSDAHGEEDSRYDCSEELEELYPEYLGKGYWLMWTQGGKGSCIQTTIEGVFEPKKLKVFNWDIQGTSVITRLVYDGDELDDEGMDGEHDNWRGQWAQFDVYHNTK